MTLILPAVFPAELEDSDSQAGATEKAYIAQLWDMFQIQNELSTSVKRADVV